MKHHFAFGIHHITAIASDPQTTYDFYAKVLGLRLVKKTVNQDDVTAYHLFFGDTTGEPGMDLTFFTFQPVAQGVPGLGQVTAISLAVPDSSLEFWQARLANHQVKHHPIDTWFGRRRLVLFDADGQRIELVGLPQAEPVNDLHVWETSEVTKEHAIRSFYSARLSVLSAELVDPVLEYVLGYRVVEESQQSQLYRVDEDRPGVDDDDLHYPAHRAAYLEVVEAPLLEPGINAAGTVHHIAFAVANEQALLQLREKIFEVGLYPTEVIDRFYFKSVYFRTRAGILFELATMGPGFTADEPADALGERLSLPPFLADHRAEIEANLVPIVTKARE
jgi:glyoxalase family protein